MPVITFANTKGGAGKTTAVLLLATELARQGHRVTVLDADPQFWMSRWYDLSQPLQRLSVVPYVTQASIDRHLEESRHSSDYILIDLPGARSPLLAKAIGLSDHVLIPIQGCAMDAQGGAHVLELLHYLDSKLGLKVPHSVVLTRVNSMVTTRALLAVKGLLAQRNVDVLNTPIIERSAFRDVFDCGGTLYSMTADRVSNLDKARENARLYADEILRRVPAKLAAPRTRQSVA
ncbi:ParA family protein [Rhizobium sp. SSA_523]|uniref:ParA family protein n=1 Tax=Rhizobium sp. SSA_523 TaxID=2952477 RepID=UPI002090FB8F|nr:ParA family protein [Rhizobium sp. SSA_523]MCO5734813.1 ParA family protein [Rhizobium sp. SSA_523]WKC23456.1 ParA family protein [Rhizobium sp. SSA_523]